MVDSPVNAIVDTQVRSYVMILGVSLHLAHKQADSADTVQIQDDTADQERIKVRADALLLKFYYYS